MMTIMVVRTINFAKKVKEEIMEIISYMIKQNLP